jgi:cytochrome c oxidase assembly factor CtaG
VPGSELAGVSPTSQIPPACPARTRSPAAARPPAVSSGTIEGYDASLRHPHSLLVVEHALYLLTGVAMWWCVWQDVPHRLSSQSRAGYVFAGFVLSAPLGLMLALVPDPLYDFYAAAPERLWGLSRIADQQYGGIAMASEQSIVFFAIFAYWFIRFLHEQDHEPSDDVDRIPAGS